MSSPEKTGATSNRDDAQDIVDSVKDLSTAVADVGNEAREQVTNLTDQIRQQAAAQLVSQKQQIVDGLETVALLLHQAGEHAEQQDKALIANYVEKAAQQVGTMSESLSQQDVTQMLETTRDFARREPMLFVGGALLAGFLGARFMRSSAGQTASNGQAQSSNGNVQSAGMNDTATGLPAYDMDQASSTSAEDAFEAAGLFDDYQANASEGPDTEIDAGMLTGRDDADRVENL